VLTVDCLPVSGRSIPTVDDVAHWSYLQDIDFPQLDGKEITILIESDVPEAHWSLEERRGGPKEPLAVRTLLGWTLFGPMGSGTSTERTVNFVHLTMAKKHHIKYNNCTTMNSTIWLSRKTNQYQSKIVERLPLWRNQCVKWTATIK
jgi:hypothetical protein